MREPATTIARDGNASATYERERQWREAHPPIDGADGGSGRDGGGVGGGGGEDSHDDWTASDQLPNRLEEDELGCGGLRWLVGALSFGVHDLGCLVYLNWGTAPAWSPHCSPVAVAPHLLLVAAERGRRRVGGGIIFSAIIPADLHFKH